MASRDSGPGSLAARYELADLIAEAEGGLSDLDRAVLELAYRHGLDGVDLAAALEVSVAQARAMALRIRQMVERSLGALLVARRVRGEPGLCPVLATMLNEWDEDFTPPVRRRVVRHMEDCPACELERRRRVSPATLLGVPPVFIPAPDWLRAETLRRIQLPPPGPGVPTPTPPALRVAAGGPVVRNRRSRRLAVVGGLIALLIAVVVAGRAPEFEPPYQPAPVLTPPAPTAPPAGLAPPATTFETPVPAAHPIPPAVRPPAIDVRTSEPSPRPVRQPPPGARPSPPDASDLRPTTRPVGTTPRRTTSITPVPPHRPAAPGSPGRHRPSPKSPPPAQSPQAADNVS